jgi:iron complex transport system ATP-binding protein
MGAVAPESPVILETKDVAFAYGNQTVLDGVTMSVGRGEVFCLFGPNGCGKTTLLECILGLAHVKRGDVLIGGVSVASLGPAELARRIAYVPQLHRRTFPYTVEQVVLMGRTAHTGMLSSPSAEDYAVAAEAMATVGVKRLQGRPYTQLSGGELQLVMIARALAQQAPVLVLDEPTTHLDFRNELLILETIVHLVRDKQLSLVVATHSPNHALYFENNGLPATVALMSGGVLQLTGRPSAVLTDENMRDTFGVSTRIVPYPLDYPLGGARTGLQIVPVGIVSSTQAVRSKSRNQEGDPAR